MRIDQTEASLVLRAQKERITRRDGLELIFHKYPIYATSIANPCFGLFVHVHKKCHDTLDTSVLRAKVARGGKINVELNILGGKPSEPSRFGGPSKKLYSYNVNLLI